MAMTCLKIMVVRFFVRMPVIRQQTEAIQVGGNSFQHSEHPRPVESNKLRLDICIGPKIHNHVFATLQALQPVSAASQYLNFSRQARLRALNAAQMSLVTEKKRSEALGHSTMRDAASMESFGFIDPPCSFAFSSISSPSASNNRSARVFTNSSRACSLNQTLGLRSGSRPTRPLAARFSTCSAKSSSRAGRCETC